MNSLVEYASSDDEEEEDTQSERPVKVARTESTAASNKSNTTATLPLPTEQVGPPDPKTQAPPSGSNATSNGRAPAQADAPLVTAPAPLATNPDAPPFSPYVYERQRLRELTMPTVPNFEIPDSPPPPPRNSEEAAALAATTKKFERFLELKKQGVHFHDRLQKTSSLQNPSLLPKLMEFAGISKEESYASSLPDELSVPVKWPEDSYIENLLRQNERREKKRLAERDKLDFVPASRSGGSSANGTPASDGSRKSRFDKKR